MASMVKIVNKVIGEKLDPKTLTKENYAEKMEKYFEDVINAIPASNPALKPVPNRRKSAARGKTDGLIEDAGARIVGRRRAVVQGMPSPGSGEEEEGEGDVEMQM